MKIDCLANWLTEWVVWWEMGKVRERNRHIRFLALFCRRPFSRSLALTPFHFFVSRLLSVVRVNYPFHLIVGEKAEKGKRMRSEERETQREIDSWSISLPLFDTIALKVGFSVFHFSSRLEWKKKARVSLSLEGVKYHTPLRLRVHSWEWIDSRVVVGG